MAYTKNSVWDQHNFDNPGVHLQDDYLWHLVNSTVGVGLTNTQWATLIVSLQDSMRANFPGRWEEQVSHCYTRIPFIPSNNYLRDIHPEGVEYSLKTVVRYDWPCINSRPWLDTLMRDITVSPFEFINVRDYDRDTDVRLLNYVSIQPWNDQGPVMCAPEDIIYVAQSLVDFTTLTYVFRTNALYWFQEEVENICSDNHLVIDSMTTLPFLPHERFEYTDCMYVISHQEVTQPASRTCLSKREIVTDW